MIKKIDSINGFGIFNDFKWSTDLKELNKFNLFYGWNGSGKSTISKLLRTLETGIIPSDFSKSEFKLTTEKGEVNQSLEREGVIDRIVVFNDAFIDANTDLKEGKAQSIVFIGEENVELNKKIEKLSIKIKDDQEKCAKEKSKRSDLVESQNKFHTSAGAELKRLHSSTIFSREQYHKTKSEQIWAFVEKGQSLNDFILSDKIFEEQLSFIKQGENREPINELKYGLSQDQLDAWYKRYHKLMFQTPVNNSIERLKDNPDIMQWVQHGIDLHLKHDSLKCEYCLQPIDAERKERLKEHFSNEFLSFQKSLEDLINELSSVNTSIPLINKENLIPECRERFEELFINVAGWNQELQRKLEVWIENLKSKKANPLVTDKTVENIIEAGHIQNEISILNGVISYHNKKITEFKKNAEQYKDNLNKHMIASKAKDEKLTVLLDQIKLSAESIAKMESITRKDLEDKKALEDQLANDTIVIAQINRDLHKFLSREDITLEKNEGGGYLLKRAGKIARNLSEGEKTAISLVYFINKLQEEGNELQSTIVVFDDPISSFDSNHLFNASTYIMNRCSEAKQVFILTHNFWFFKLIRDWIKRENEKKIKKDKSPVGNFYRINRGSLCNADKTLINHHSEYHHVFSELKRFSELEGLPIGDNFIVANMGRRLLESFNAFKTPDISGFASILDKALDEDFTKDQKERIYYFVNKYSHLDRIETHEHIVENTEVEGVEIAKSILKVIEKVDPDHYSSMVKLCG